MENYDLLSLTIRFDAANRINLSNSRIHSQVVDKGIYIYRDFRVEEQRVGGERESQDCWG